MLYHLVGLFPLPHLSSLLTSTRATLINTRGLALFKGFPVQEWGIQKATTAYDTCVWGLALEIW